MILFLYPALCTSRLPPGRPALRYRGSLAAQPAMPAPEAAPPDSDKIAALLGANQPADSSIGPASVNLPTHFKLLGVMAQGGAGSHGSTLIAVADQPAKPFRVDDVVADGLLL